MKSRTVVRGIGAGFAGTTAMTLTGAAYARLRGPGEPDSPVADFDRSDHVVDAAATILRLDVRSPAARTALFQLVHWGYGSCVGIGLSLLVRARVAAPTVLFFAGCQTMAATVFPLAGGTPPPWRWTREQLAVSVVQHLVYAVTARAALDVHCGRRRSRCGRGRARR